jgi:hypothetical protein
MAGPYAAVNEQVVRGATFKQSFDFSLKDDYLPEADALLHDGSQQAARKITTKRDKMGGSKSVAMQFTGRPAGVGFRLEGHAYPTHTPPRGINPVIIARFLKARDRITFEADIMSKVKASAAWSQARQRQLTLLRQQIEIDWAGNIIRGNANVLGVVTTGAGSTTQNDGGVVPADPPTAGSTVTLTFANLNGRTSATGNFFAAGARQTYPFTVGQAVQVVRAANGNLGAATTTHGRGLLNALFVTAIDTSNPEAPTVTLAPQTGGIVNTICGGSPIAAGDLIIPYASRTDNPLGSGNAADQISNYASMNGLMNPLSQGVYAAFMGILKSAEPNLQATVLENGGTPAPFSKRALGLCFRQASMTLGMKMVGKESLCTPDTVDEVFAEDMGLQRYGEVQGTKGYGADLKIMMHGTPLTFAVDDYMLPGVFCGVDPEAWGYYEAYPLAPPDDFSNRFIPDFDQQESMLVKGGNIACWRPRAQWRYDDVRYSGTAVT